MTLDDRIATLAAALRPLVDSERNDGWLSARQTQRATLAVGEEVLRLLREQRREELEAQR